jgi:hypothetical protein
VADPLDEEIRSTKKTSSIRESSSAKARASRPGTSITTRPNPEADVSEATIGFARLAASSVTRTSAVRGIRWTSRTVVRGSSVRETSSREIRSSGR